ncbi:phage tail protein [Sodalis sp. RH18]|uniref:phage tail-collar fiber domain-containing protein n=1 Tax=Sodalis sp. RH18 TaxID=3394333 RepID=UPI0039B451AD
MPSIITRKFEQWAASRQAANLPARPDTFIFANVPGQNADAEISRDEAVPAAQYIVHTAPVLQYGMLNADAVVFSVILDTTVGDFEYNWIGLRDSASGTLCMIVHTMTQKKIATSGDGQGNTLTRTLAMQYSGAAAAAQITVTPATWQIDFSARLFGIDRRLQLANLDRYGHHAFVENAYLVAGNASPFALGAGVGYVGGIRTEQAAGGTVVVAALPAVIWLDVSLQGQVTSRWDVVSKVTPAVNLADYVDALGFSHYVTAIASIDANGNVTDLRPKGSLAEQNAELAYLKKAANLSDLENKTTARNNLDVYSKAIADGKYLIKANGAEITGVTSFNFESYIVKKGSILSQNGAERYINGLRLENGSLISEFYSHELIGNYFELVIHVADSNIPANSYEFRFRQNGYLFAKRFIPDEFNNWDDHFDARYDARYDDRFNPRYAYKTEAVIDTRLGAAGNMVITHDTWVKAPSGCMVTGYYYEGDNPASDVLEYKPIQININGNWRTISG